MRGLQSQSHHIRLAWGKFELKFVFFFFFLSPHEIFLSVLYRVKSRSAFDAACPQRLLKAFRRRLSTSGPSWFYLNSLGCETRQAWGFCAHSGTLTVDIGDLAAPHFLAAEERVWNRDLLTLTVRISALNLIAMKIAWWFSDPHHASTDLRRNI